jgi:hypothetical protein
MKLQNITGSYIKITALGISVAPKEVIDLGDIKEKQVLYEINRAIDKGWFSIQKDASNVTTPKLTGLRRAVFVST